MSKPDNAQLQLACMDPMTEVRPARLPARRSDPEPSKRAAASLRTGRMCEAFLRGLRLCGGRATANEAADSGCQSGMRASDVRKRYWDLLNAGRIVQDGEKRCFITGKNVAVYKEIK